jgi:exopolysaccharide biosynthesis WecB/TagA/CpsF family protein
VLIPAHNEEAVLASTLSSLMPQIHAGDRAVVIADNCDDATAAIALQHGAEVIERNDTKRRGKGYALDFGMRHLESDAPDIVVMMDADCHVHEGAVDALAAQVVDTGKPAQAVYLLERPSRPGPKDLVSALAFMVKNLVRPSGLGRLGLPCLLTGTGMAFPWAVIRRAKLASSNIVEDMQLGLDLALAGHAPRFCERARVTGKLPEQRRAAVTQRTRWEHGHLQTMFTQIPRLVRGAMQHRRLSALALALELIVPPLSLLVLMFLAAMGAAVLAGNFGASWVALNLLLGGGTLVAVCILCAWLKFGRQQLPLTSLLAAPFYVVWKIPLYFAFVFKPQKEWVRTDRSTLEPAPEGMNDTFPIIPDTFAKAAAFSPARPPAVIDLCGVGVHAVTERQCINQIMRHSTAGRGGVCVTPNLDFLRRCSKDADFAALVAQADLVVADGMPLVWAAKLQGTPLPGRVAGSDLISSLSAAAAQHGKTLFLLGGDPGTADAAAAVLRDRHPGIKIAGTYCPPFGFDKDADKMRELTNAVTAANPDVIFVALGSPKQERLIERLRDRLPGAWWLGVGVSFSFLAGQVKRAPQWMRSLGLEWVHRLAQEPGRLFKRYVVHGIPFAVRLLTAAAVRGLVRRFTFRRPEPTITVALDSGIGSIDIEVSESALIGEQRRKITPRKNANALADSRGGPEMVYRSFLSGFASESFVGAGQHVAPFTQAPPPPADRVPDVLQHVKAVVLLGGSVRPNKLTAAIERSILDLPLEDGKSILWHWQEQARALRAAVGCSHLPVRVMVDHASTEPLPPLEIDGVCVSVERDLSQYRGTGGLLRDLSAEYEDDDVLVVANAAQALVMPLADLARSLAEFNGDVSLISHADGTPSGLMLVRCRALRGVSQTGYVDMKEQALPAIAKEFKVTHLFQTAATGLPIRTLEEYVAALQRRYRLNSGRPVSNDPFAEDRRPTFAIVEKGAEIDRDARVLD